MIAIDARQLTGIEKLEILRKIAQVELLVGKHQAKEIEKDREERTKHGQSTPAPSPKNQRQ